MSVQSQLKAYAEKVDRRLSDLLPASDANPHALHEAMRYSALAPGKRIRPALVLGSAASVGGSPDDALDAACAVELVHCFSLIHDDLPAIDNDDLRRGRPTCHVKYGEAVAILAGDALFALAFEALALSRSPADRLLRATGALTKATAALVRGECIDILSEGTPVAAETLQCIHEWKTGALFAASCEIGALLGGGSDDQVTRLGQYGRHIGLGFQIADDVLNETSTPELLGKAAGSDRERGKATYPSRFGLESSRQAARDEVRSGLDALGRLASDPFLSGIADFAIERLA